MGLGLPPWRDRRRKIRGVAGRAMWLRECLDVIWMSDYNRLFGITSMVAKHTNTISVKPLFLSYF